MKLITTFPGLLKYSVLSFILFLCSLRNMANTNIARTAYAADYPILPAPVNFSILLPTIVIRPILLPTIVNNPILTVPFNHPIPLADTLSSIPLALSSRFTTNLIFPFTIFKADLGSGEIIAKKWGKAENVLLLKASKPGFATTNISVYLENGDLYSFTVHYADTLTTFNYSFHTNSPLAIDPTEEFPPKLKLSGLPADKEKLSQDARQIEKAHSFLHISKVSGKVKLCLKSIYLKDQLLWLGLQARNRSLIDFQPSHIRFSLEDARRIRRTAVQSLDVLPLFIQFPDKLAGHSQTSLISAFQPFTIARGKKLVVEWNEQNSGRIIRLAIRTRHLLKIRNLK